MFKTLLTKLAAGLSRAGIPYMIIGGQAVLLYGEPRLTKDIDITLGVEPGSLDSVLNVVKKSKLQVLVDDCAAFVAKTMVLPAVDNSSGIRVDLIFSTTGYERQAIARAKRIMVDKKPVMFASVEDLIIHKVIAKRPRDLEDVKSIMRKNNGYDRDYVIRWLDEFDSALDGGFLAVFYESEKA
ncbi:MAG: nucleotidyltransferase [Spirochaetes bacterium]|nr:nucleotidyltransferase [Spirochaetota bacterium]